MQAIGEVLSSSITGFSAEAWRFDAKSAAKRKGDAALPSVPYFGSFLKSKSENRDLVVFGVVYDILTGPQDPYHKPTALGMSRAELQREQPQIFALLKTEWKVAIIGYKQDGRCYCALPPYPPEVHDFVYPLEGEELVEASEDLEFLRSLVSVSGVPADELIAAAIRHAAQPRRENYKYLVEAGQIVSKLLRDDYDRLGSILKKIRP